MEKLLNNSLTYRHISHAADEIVKYIDDRRKGSVKSLSTRWGKFNNTCMGGIEPNTIYSIGGISGSGKSSFINSLESDLFDLNPDNKFYVLNFSFEMQSSRQVGRKLSAKLKKTTSELYSGLSGYQLNDHLYDQVVRESKGLKNYDIYYVDMPGTIAEIRSTIETFRLNISKDKWLVIMLDHTLLVKERVGESERIAIANLQKLFMEQKKIGLTTIIQLTQMNRGIENSDRISNPQLHYPTRADIFASDSVYQASDYVIVLHRPETLGILKYGITELNTQNMIYLHILKNRDGEVKILAFVNNLKYNTIEEPQN